MGSKVRYIPTDLAEHSLCLYTDFGIDVVTRYDAKGHAVELNVPYAVEPGRMCSYKIKTYRTDVKVTLLGAKPYPCSLTGNEKQELLDLFCKIDKAKRRRREPVKGPHQVRICT